MPGYSGAAVVGSGPNAPVHFENVSKEVGLGGITGLYQSFCWFDYNNDEYEDLLMFGRYLFKNNGPPNWGFTNATIEAGIDQGIYFYANAGDYDNDGWEDFYATDMTDYPHSSDHLWHNNGDGTFTDMTEAAGHVTDIYPSASSAWGDYDQDGYIDLYVFNWGSNQTVYYPDKLWHNDGDGTFTDATVSSGVDETADPAASLGGCWGDYNDDGWLDIYVGNYFLAPNYLYENQGDGTFKEVAADKGCEGHATDRMGNTYYGHSPGAAFVDLDDDQNMDIWVSNNAHRDLYRAGICDSTYYFNSDGPGSNYTFTDLFTQTGVPYSPPGGDEELYFGETFADWDNDGDQDLFLPRVHDDIDYAYCLMFRNDGNNELTDVTDEAGIKVWNTVNSAFCDYDQDGGMDMAVGGKDPFGQAGNLSLYEFRLYQNEGNANNWIGIKLTGAEANRDAIGARVTISLSDGRQMMREVQSTAGTHSCGNSKTQHYGLGTYGGTVDATIRWSNSNTQVVRGLDINRIHYITEAAPSTDLEVANVSFPASIDQGEIADFEVTVKNVGGQASVGYEVTLRYATVSGALLVNITSDWELAPGQARKHSLGWDTTGYEGRVTVFAGIETVKPADSLSSNDFKVCAMDILKVYPNRAPTINSFSSAEERLYLGATTALSVKAMDPDSDPLSYSYTATGGKLSPSGDSAQWTAPGIAGVYTITVAVGDGQGHETTADLDILVQEPLNDPPRIVSFTYEPMDPSNDGSVKVTLTLRVSDDQGLGDLTKAVFHVGALGGSGDMTITDAADGKYDGVFVCEVLLPAVLEPGDKVISVDVYDKQDAKATAEATVTVMDSEQVGDDDGSDGSGIGIAPLLLVIGVIVIAFILVSLVVYVLRRRN